MMLEQHEIRLIVEQLKAELLPIGSILIYPSERIPSGFLPCDGSELSKRTYPELYSLIKGTWGETKDSFFLPDLQGQFVRGWDNDGDIDPGRVFGSIQNDAFQGHGHKFIVEGQLSEDGSHSHSVYYNDAPIRYGKNTFSSDAQSTVVHYFYDWDTYYRYKYEYKWSHENNYAVSRGGSHTHKLPTMTVTDAISCANGLVSPQNETRPKNIALMFCIKVK